MIDAFLRGVTLPAAEADTAIVSLTARIADAGYGESMTITELAEAAEQFFGYRSRIVEEVTIESIKREIAAGNPVIIPAAGKELQNPYFSGGGPWYHMLVITGYDETHFVTNDPGTVLGLGFRYPQEHLIAAVHDWTGRGETIGTGSKAMLVLIKDRSPSPQ
jgi:hypothetical protein